MIVTALPVTVNEMGWILDFLALSLENSVLVSADEPKRPPPGGPFGKLIEHVLFSRKFILTYHLVVFGVVLIFTIRHWGGKAIRWKRRRVSRLKTLRLDDAYDGDAETIKPKL